MQQTTSKSTTSEDQEAPVTGATYPRMRDHFRSAAVGGLIGFIGSLPALALTVGAGALIRNPSGGIPLASVVTGLVSLLVIANHASKANVPSKNTCTVSSVAGAVAGFVGWPAIAFATVYSLGTMFAGEKQADTAKVENIPPVSVPAEKNGANQALVAPRPKVQ